MPLRLGDIVFAMLSVLHKILHKPVCIGISVVVKTTIEKMVVADVAQNLGQKHHKDHRRLQVQKVECSYSV